MVARPVGVDVAGQTDDVVGAAQEPVERVEEIFDAGGLGGVSNKPLLALRHKASDNIGLSGDTQGQGHLYRHFQWETPAGSPLFIQPAM